MNQTSLARILNGHGAEMFVSGDDALIACDRQTYLIAEAPIHIKRKLRAFMYKDPQRAAAYMIMAGPDENAQMEKCIKCMFANLDGTPDIDESGEIHNVEFVDCAERGTCAFEGIGCNSFQLPNGHFISRAQLRVLRLCHLKNSDIAEALFLSIDTVKGHIQTILSLTEFPNKTILALWAQEKGLIKQQLLWNY
jgi:DNA-binding CsgD family transcriptional regulator